MLGMGTIEALSRALNWLSYAIVGLLLPAEQFGIYSISVAIFLIFSAISSAGQDRVILRYFSSNPKITKSCLFIGLTASIIFLTLFLAAHCIQLIKVDSSLPFLSLWILFGCQINILIALARVQNDIIGFFLLRAVLAGFKFVGVLLIALTSASATHLVIYESLLSLFVVAIGLLYFSKNSSSNITKINLRTASLFGLPFILHIAAGVALGQIDKIMLAKTASNELIAQYAFLNSLAGGSFFIYAILNIKYESKIYEQIDPKKVESLLSFVTKRSFIWALTVLIILNALTPSVLLSLGKEHLNNSAVLGVLSIAYLIYPLYLQSNIRFAWYEKTKAIPPLTILSAIVNIILNLIFIPLIGILGAAISTLIAYVFLCLSTQYVSRKAIS